LSWSVDEVGDHFAVGVGQELAARGLHLLAQRLEILDDAVVNEGDAVDDVRMGVAVRRRAVRGPARVGDADGAGERLLPQHPREIVELPLGTAAVERSAHDRADSRRIVAAIFEPPQALHQPVGDFIPPEDADDSAHNLYTPSLPRKRGSI
jgi:hypothetical protein